jgi:hypothetical protein
MPIQHRIEHEQRLVLAEGHGTVSAEEVMRYQLEVWSRPDVAGFDELFDMTDVEKIVGDSSAGMRNLAEVSARADLPGGSSKFAIVAPDEVMFGVSRMYESYRELNPRSTKQVAVFRKLAEALAWIAGEPSPTSEVQLDSASQSRPDAGPPAPKAGSRTE